MCMRSSPEKSCRNNLLCGEVAGDIKALGLGWFTSKNRAYHYQRNNIPGTTTVASRSQCGAYANSLQPRLPVRRFNRESTIPPAQPCGGCFAELSPIADTKRIEVADRCWPLMGTSKRSHTALRTSWAGVAVFAGYCLRFMLSCRVDLNLYTTVSRYKTLSSLCYQGGSLPTANSFPWKMVSWGAPLDNLLALTTVIGLTLREPLVHPI